MFIILPYNSIIQMSKKSKSIKKYDGIRAISVKQLAKKHEVTEDFVRKSINGDAQSDTAVQILKEYRKLYKELEETLKK